jgi:type IV pilus assembly protein PilA
MMPVEPDPLSRTKPLSDPVRVITILMVTSAIVLLVVSVVVLMPTLGVLGALHTLSLALVLMSLAILLGLPPKPNAIYLRAFRTDRSTAELRAKLAAILGPGFRLSGIRPPQKKTSTFTRFLMPGLIALRYAGSRFMELEAGDDWMARLWKTYQNCRVVFIDVRDVTVHVHREIQMTLETMGTERSIFVVSAARPDDEWRQLIATIAGPEKDPARFNLLHADVECIRSGQLATELTAILKTLPPGVPEPTGRGKQFVLQQVSSEQLKEGRRLPVMTVVSAVAAIAVSTGLGLLPSGIQAVVLVPLSLVGLGVIIGAILRAASRIGSLSRSGHRAAAGKASLLLAAALLLLLGSFGLIAAAAIPALLNSRQQADEASAISALRTIVLAESMYQSTYPAEGYACRLSQLGGNPQAGPATAQSAQLIDNHLASGQWYGYTFTISHCTPLAPQGDQTGVGYQVTAIPDNPQRGHPRGFCIDQTDMILADPNGGANCTDGLQ